MLCFIEAVFLIGALIMGNIALAASTAVAGEVGQTADNGQQEASKEDTEGQGEAPNEGEEGNIGNIGEAKEDTDEPEETDPEEDSKDDEENPEEGDGDDSEEGDEKLKLKKAVLKAASKPDGSIELSWGKVEGAQEYVLLRSTKKDSGFEQIYAAGAKINSYTDKGRVLGKAYYYQLMAFSKDRAEYSKSKTATGRSLKQVELTEISNVSGSRKLVLHWKPVKGADSYQIMRKDAQTGKYQAIGTVKGTESSYADAKRTGGEYYTYKVCAKDANDGRGSYSKAMSQMAIDKNKKMIALTYDDGPSIYTPIVLKALEKYKVHVTFFVVGNRVEQYADSLRREVELGCEIGNHTYEHTILSKASAKQVQTAMAKTNQAVKKQAGVDIRTMRPPGGGYNSTVRSAVGLPLIMWSIDTLDWKTRSTSATIQCVMQKAYDGAVVLMHDLHKPTANAADTIFKQLKAKGYQLVTVSEMAAYRGGMKAGQVYSQFRK